MSREIPLTKGYCAIVDDHDFEWLSSYRWYAHCNRGGHVYARRATDITGRTYFMHRELTGPDPGEDVDHANGNSLDNRRSNLRIATRQQNNWNRRPQRGSSSPYVGVSWAKDRGLWVAAIERNDRKIWIGSFESAEEAARAYDAKALELRGEFACLNFPTERSVA